MIMYKYLLGAFVVSSQLIAPTLSSCNYKLLELESDSLNTKILTGISVTKPVILERLKFLYTDKDIEEKYKNPVNFDSLYQETLEKGGNSGFVKFAQNCQELYKDPDLSPKTQSAIHLLLEEVSRKYLKIRKLADKHAELVIQSDGDENYYADKVACYAADKFFDTLPLVSHAKTRID